MFSCRHLEELECKTPSRRSPMTSHYIRLLYVMLRCITQHYYIILYTLHQSRLRYIRLGYITLH